MKKAFNLKLCVMWQRATVCHVFANKYTCLYLFLWCQLLADH